MPPVRPYCLDDPSLCIWWGDSDNKIWENPRNIQQQDQGLSGSTICSATCRQIKVWNRLNNSISCTVNTYLLWCYQSHMKPIKIIRLLATWIWYFLRHTIILRCSAFLLIPALGSKQKQDFHASTEHGTTHARFQKFFPGGGGGPTLSKKKPITHTWILVIWLLFCELILFDV